MIAIVPGFGSFPYQEKVPGSPVYTFSNASSRVERTFTCDWANRHGLVRWLIGYPTIQNVTPGGTRLPYTTVSRFIPDSMPDCLVPGKTDTWLFATSIVRMVGSGETGLYDTYGIAEYQTAIVTVSYEPRTYRIVQDSEVLNSDGAPDESTMLRYVTRFNKPSAEFIQLPRGTMRWVDGIKNADNTNQPVDYATARLIPSTEYALTWHEVPFIPEAATDFVGALNLFTFTIESSDENTPPKLFKPGVLLVLSAEIKPYRTAAGVFVQDITYRIKYFEPQPGRGHNFFLRYDKTAKTLIYEKITSDGSNDSVAIFPDAITFSPYNPAAPPQPPPDRRVSLAPGTSRAVYPYAGFTSLFRLAVDTNDSLVGQ